MLSGVVVVFVIVLPHHCYYHNKYNHYCLLFKDRLKFWNRALLWCPHWHSHTSWSSRVDCFVEWK